MRLYTHTHTCVLKNRKKEKQKKLENINVADSLLKENANIINSTNMLIKYGNSARVQEYAVNNIAGINNKIEQKSKRKIKKKEDKLQKVSCLLVIRKIVVIMMGIIIAILVFFRENYNWKIENIIEKIGKVINISGTRADIEEVVAMDMTKVDLVPDKNKVNVPVPKGYVLSGASDENDVTKGAVIYEGTAAVTDANVATERLTRNQWVWVPVPAANVSRIYSEDAYGRKSGKLYDYNSEGRTTNTDGAEPYVCLEKNDTEQSFQNYNLYGYTKSKLYEEMQKNYEETIESIKIYGGFYVGRYETGDLSQRKPVCMQYKEDLTLQNWYTMYSKAQYVGGSASVKSMMMYGSLFDEILMQLQEKGLKNWDEIGVDSTSWGNYYNAKYAYFGSADLKSPTWKEEGYFKVLPTGAKVGSDEDNWKRNLVYNIYDIAGNIWEWTQEGNNPSNRRTRAGSFAVNGDEYPVCFRGNYDPLNDVDFVGFRCFLIIL